MNDEIPVIALPPSGAELAKLLNNVQVAIEQGDPVAAEQHLEKFKKACDLGRAITGSSNQGPELLWAKNTSKVEIIFDLLAGMIKELRHYGTINFSRH